MAETVDSLSIELTASTESAETSIDRLIGKLNQLKSAVTGASNFSRFAKGIAEIAEAAKGLDTEAGRKLARLAGGLDALSKVGSLDNLKGAGKNLASVMKAVSGQIGGKGLSGLADGIKQTNDALGGIKDSDVSKLGAIRDTLAGEVSGPLHTSDRVSESTALGGMGASEPSFGNMAAYGAMTVFKYTADSIRDATAAYREFGAALADGGSSVETQFSDSAMTVFKYTADSIRDATAAYREFRAALGGGMPPVFTDFTDSAAQAGESVRMLTGSVGGGQEGPWEADEIRDAARAYDDLGGSASRAADVIETEFANPFANFKMKPLDDDFTRASGAAMDMSQSLEYAGATFSRFNSIAWNVGNAASHVTSGFMQMSGIGGFARDILYGVGNDADTAAGKMGGLAKIVQEVGGAFSRYGFAAIPRYFGAQLIGNVQNATKGMTGFFNSIVRIAKYRLIRTALRMITQGINEGMKNLYAFSQAAGGTFAASMNQIATASKYMGNSFAAMASPLVNALAPAIDFIVDKFVDMFNTISQIIARLTGQTSYIAAKKVASQWSGAANSAGKSAKNAADEIKRTLLGFDEINKLNDNKDASGGGSGGGGGSGSGASSIFEEIPIDSAVASFADSLKAAFLEGDWQELGTLLGTKVNELVDSVDWAGAGQTVGYYINGWFSTEYWTLDTINFTNIGSKIAEFLNNAIAEIDFGIIGALLVQKMTIIGDLVIGFFAEFNWAQAGEKLSDFVQGLFNELTKWLEKYGQNNDLNWGTIGESIVNGLVDFFKNFDYSGTAKSISEFLGAAIGAGIKLISGIGKAIGEKIGEAFEGIGQYFDDKIKEAGGNVVLGILNGILEGIKNIATWIVENIFTPFINGFKNAFGIASPAKKMEEPGENIVLGIFQGIINALANVGQWVIENIFTPIWNAISEAGATAIEIAVSLVKKVGEWAGDVWDFLQNTGATIAKTVKAGFEAAKTFAGDVWESVKSGAATIVKEVKAIFTEVGKWAGDVWDTVKTGAETIVKEVKAIFSEVGTWAGNVWNAVKAGAETIVKEVKAIFTEVGTWAGNVWDTIKSGAETIVKTVKAVFTEVGTWAGNVWNAVKAGAETIVKTVNAIFSEVGTWAGNVWDAVKAGKETIVKTVVAGMKKAASWIDSVVDFILGPESTEKKANIALALENTALAIVNFLRDPAQAIKNVILSLGLKFAQGVEKFWNWITGQDGQSEVVFDAYGNMMIVPKAGDGLTDNGNGQFSLTNDVAGTTVLSPTKSDNWQQEWDKLVGDEIPVVVKPTNSLGNKITSPLQWLFGSNTTPEVNTKVNGTAGTGFSGLTGNKFTLGGVNDTSTKVNASAGTGFSGLTGNKFSLSGINAGSVTVNGTPGAGFVGQLSGTGHKYTLAGIEDANVNVKSNLTGKAKGSKTLPDVYGDFKTKSILTGANKDAAGAKTLTGIYGDFKTKSILTGANKDAEGAKTLTGIYGDFNTKSILTGAVRGTNDLTDVYGKSFDTRSKLVGQSRGSKTLSKVHGNVFKSYSKLTGKSPGSKTLTGVFGSSFTVTAKLSSTIDGLREFVNRIAEAIKKAIQGITAQSGGVISNGKFSRFASGGIIRNNLVRRLDTIPHYAGGTTDAHGTLFVAGEAGPEILGHIGGRTEILNQSQLAATMFSAVRSAMSGVKIAATMYDGGADNGEADYETMYRAMYDAFTDAMAGSNERDREKVALMRQIAAKEFTAEVTAASVNRAQTRMNRRAGTTIVPVGT